MLTTIISGGETGADQGGLRAAKSLGYKTGGCMPRGFRTANGPAPGLAQEFGLREHTSSRFSSATRTNVQDADGTIRFARDFQSPGSQSTLKFIRQYGKPYLDIDMDNPRPVEEVRRWLDANKIKVLNVAGNREKLAPGIERFVTEYLVKVLSSSDSPPSSSVSNP